MLTSTEPMPASDEGRAPGAEPQNRYFYPEPGAQDAAERRGSASLGAPYAGGALVPAPPGRFLGAYAYPPGPGTATGPRTRALGSTQGRARTMRCPRGWRCRGS